MPTVWITQEVPDFNYTSAEKFGDVKFVTSKNFNAAMNSLINADLSKEIKDSLRGFDYDNDYVVPTGSPIVSMAVAAMLGRNTSKLKILKWDKRDYRYLPMVIGV